MEHLGVDRRKVAPDGHQKLGVGHPVRRTGFASRRRKGAECGRAWAMCGAKRDSSQSAAGVIMDPPPRHRLSARPGRFSLARW